MEAQLLNNYYEAVQTFCGEFDENEDQIYHETARKICTELFANSDLPLDDPNHPFHQYAAPNTISQNVDRLATAVRANMEMSQERSALLSFVHPGGVNYDLLMDLMNDYWDYVDCVIGNDEGNNQPHNNNNQDNGPDQIDVNNGM